MPTGFLPNWTTVFFECSFRKSKRPNPAISPSNGEGRPTHMDKKKQVDDPQIRRLQSTTNTNFISKEMNTMTLIRWKPAQDSTHWPSDFWSVQREINRIFDTFMQGGMQDDGSLGLPMGTPAVDIVERENEFEVKVELPGVSKDDVKITLESNVLTIRGEKKQEREEKGENTHRVG